MLKSVGQPIPAISHRLAQNEDAIDLFKMVLDGKSLLSYVQFGTTIKDSLLDSIEHRIPFDLFLIQLYARVYSKRCESLLEENEERLQYLRDTGGDEIDMLELEYQIKVAKGWFDEHDDQEPAPDDSDCLSDG